MNGDIHIRKEGRAGRITLTRPDALNALTYDMAMAIEAALTDWARDDAVHLVLIDAEGRAFCAGGDIQQLYETGVVGDFEFGRKFWADEYRLNAAIANFPKPYVALMDGIVMGGGVGIACHGSHRIVTENTMLAMPESAIGLIPDVGGSFLLSQSSGAIGEYLAATGARLGAYDAIYAGFADGFIPSEKLEELVRNLVHSGDATLIEAFFDMPESGFLKEHSGLINLCFAENLAAVIADTLEAEGSEWAAKQAKMMRRNCPLSVACSIELVRRCRKVERIEDALALEYRFSFRSMSDGEMLEGIRAQIIDKDRNPNWKIADLAAVSAEQIEHMLAPLGERELRL
ncbi:MAG: 3-hydroxyisobutyryl-CoA hydrolase [Rhizobiaceae bacterium]